MSKQHPKKDKPIAKDKIGKQENIQPSIIIPSKYKKYTLLFATLGLTFFYFILSLMSDGFYQDDEAAHYISMRNFWHDPYSALGNWAKIGYKLIYAIPSLFGVKAVTMFNCILAASSSALAYKVTEKYDSKFAWLAFGLLALQPLWLLLCFRNYSEILSSFLLILALYLHKNNNIKWAAFVLAYICIIREEIYPILALYGLYMLINKQFSAILLACIPPLAYNFFGMSLTGDPLYMVNAVLGTSSSYAAEYPRQGFDWYPLLAEKIYGIIPILLMVSYIGMSILHKKIPSLFLLIPAVLFFLLHCVFNWQSLDFGPSTGGNHRYLLTISPLIAVMGALGMDEVYLSDKKYKLLYFILPLLLITGMFWSYEMEGIRMTEKRMWLPLGLGVLATFLLLLPIKNKSILIISLLGLALIEDTKLVKPYKKSPENEVMQKISKWYDAQLTNKSSGINENTRVYCNHTLFNFYLGKSGMDFKNDQKSVIKEDVDSAAIGDIIIWESHYSYRPNVRPTSVPIEYFTSRPQEYKVLQEYMSKDNRFMAKIFLKSGKVDQEFERGLLLMKENKFDEALSVFQKSLLSNPQNVASLTQVGLAFRQKNDYNNSLEYLNKALAIDMNYGEALLNRGGLYLAAKKYNEAITDLNSYITQKPNEPNGYLTRGNAFLGLNNFQSALNDFNALTQLAPDYGYGHLQFGICLSKLGQGQKACEAFNTAKAKGMTEADALLSQYCNK